MNPQRLCASWLEALHPIEAKMGMKTRYANPEYVHEYLKMAEQGRLNGRIKSENWFKNCALRLRCSISLFPSDSEGFGVK